MAVYTLVNDDELGRFIASYGLGELRSYKGIAEGVENTNYVVECSKGRFILTLYERRVDRRDLPFFLGLMEHLAISGVSCPTPLRDRHGQHLSELAGRPAALVTFLDGVCIRRPEPRHCALVGKALADMHYAAKGYGLSRRNALGPADWRTLYEKFAARAEEVRPGLGALIDEELRSLLPIWPQALPEGIIHADLFPDNVFFLGGQVSGLIDFYFACNDALAYDLAICLNAWCFEADFSFNITKGQALLRGYGSVRELEPSERAALPLLARGAALRFLLTRAHDWLNTADGALVDLHDPFDYVRRLRFHQSVRSAREYGLEEAP
jgi:homoserine kinase type II